MQIGFFSENGCGSFILIYNTSQSVHGNNVSNMLLQALSMQHYKMVIIAVVEMTMVYLGGFHVMTVIKSVQEIHIKVAAERGETQFWRVRIIKSYMASKSN